MFFSHIFFEVSELGIIEALLLGLVQALTEFLPVSSSGHLVLSQHWLGIQAAGDAAFEVAVHLGTLLSILVILRSEVGDLLKGFIRTESRTKVWREELSFILISAIPAGLIGVLFKDQLENAFGSIQAVSLALMATGVILLTTYKRSGNRQQVKLSDAILIGIAQAIAILPGVSRSGSTISLALWLGIQRERAARLSFLMSIPVIGGAGLLKALDLIKSPIDAEMYIMMLIGMSSSFIFGLGALSIMLKWISKPSFAYFGFYCFGLGISIFYLF